jgi:hypothetical protein
MKTLCKEPHVKYILNSLETSLQNAIVERTFFFNAITLALKTDQEKQKIQNEIELALTQLQSWKYLSVNNIT